MGSPKVWIVILILALMGSICWHLLFANWKAAYEHAYNGGTVRSLMSLPSQSVWSRPAPPDYKEFVEHFGTDSDLEEGGRILVYLQWDWLLTGILLMWVVAFACFSIVYISAMSEFRTPTARFMFRTGLGLMGGALACLLVYMVLGGWAAPVPHIFGLTGLIVGALWGLSQPRKESTIEPCGDP